MKFKKTQKFGNIDFDEIKIFEYSGEYQFSNSYIDINSFKEKGSELKIKNIVYDGEYTITINTTFKPKKRYVYQLIKNNYVVWESFIELKGYNVKTLMRVYESVFEFNTIEYFLKKTQKNTIKLIKTNKEEYSYLSTKNDVWNTYDKNMLYSYDIIQYNTTNFYKTYHNSNVGFKLGFYGYYTPTEWEIGTGDVITECEYAILNTKQSNSDNARIWYSSISAVIYDFQNWSYDYTKLEDSARFYLNINYQFSVLQRLLNYKIGGKVLYQDNSFFTDIVNSINTHNKKMVSEIDCYAYWERKINGEYIYFVFLINGDVYYSQDSVWNLLTNKSEFYNYVAGIITRRQGSFSTPLVFSENKYGGPLSIISWFINDNEYNKINGIKLSTLVNIGVFDIKYMNATKPSTISYQAEERNIYGLYEPLLIKIGMFNDVNTIITTGQQIDLKQEIYVNKFDEYKSKNIAELNAKQNAIETSKAIAENNKKIAQLQLQQENTAYNNKAYNPFSWINPSFWSESATHFQNQSAKNETIQLTYLNEYLNYTQAQLELDASLASMKQTTILSSIGYGYTPDNPLALFEINRTATNNICNFIKKFGWSINYLENNIKKLYDNIDSVYDIFFAFDILESDCDINILSKCKEIASNGFFIISNKTYN